jgi:hypothetical protein
MTDVEHREFLDGLYDHPVSVKHRTPPQATWGEWIRRRQDGEKARLVAKHRKEQIAQHSRHEHEARQRYPFTPQTALPLEELHRQRQEVEGLLKSQRAENAEMSKRHRAERDEVRAGNGRIIGELKAYAHHWQRGEE